MNLEWSEWAIIALVLIFLFGPGICLWYAGHIHEKYNKKKAKEQTQEYYVATTDADEED